MENLLWLPEPSEEGKYGTEHPGFEALGRFEPRDAKRIIKRLDEEPTPLEVDAPGEASPRPTLVYTSALSIRLRSRAAPTEDRSDSLERLEALTI